MTDLTPSPKTFDIAAVLQGRGYPELSVSFYIDEASALALAQGEKDLARLAALQRIEQYDELEKRIEALRAALTSQRFVYHVRGIPNKVAKDLLTETFQKFPHQKNVLGQEEPNEARDDYYTTRLWQAHTVKIEAPDGSVQVAPDLDTVQQFRDYAPRAALDVIDDAIRELTTGTRAGFEAITQDTDFLSQP